MNEKSKIVTIYAVVALISVLILATAFYIRGQQIRPEVTPYFSEETEFEPLLTLDEDITLTRQDGEQVKISDLKGKVWAFAQFYAACPMCAVNNEQGIKSLYEKFKDEPDFHVVCITVDPKTDQVPQLKAYAEALGADTSNWWFLTGPEQELKKYMVDVMKYDPIQEREDAAEAAEKGALAHNMSIAVYNRDLQMVGRRDLFHARQDGDAVYEETEKALHQMVEAVLKQN
ncbi:SCO family protein [Verrucomicrobiaceae bacterium R5-34]|uniref:SCO family protein n=1 Tax=Oceaniferula flava TaxID=2800421 RepID=A0AAE2SBH1_9BACT|nr:SCO family protein [Oceaniferula flavus]MBK1830058.1 SCO family protein [Verrucomicrobiaceae bacterium R5-34]MBK1855095.1 SCO family protein [Oceaniferula flavus]MBM1136401.1 SCO family protein [Oceaniferula flavus]